MTFHLVSTFKTVVLLTENRILLIQSDHSLLCKLEQQKKTRPDAFASDLVSLRFVHINNNTPFLLLQFTLGLHVVYIIPHQKILLYTFAAYIYGYHHNRFLYILPISNTKDWLYPLTD